MKTIREVLEECTMPLKVQVGWTHEMYRQQAIDKWLSEIQAIRHAQVPEKKKLPYVECIDFDVGYNFAIDLVHKGIEESK